jgi:hypothetical protein
MRVAFYCLILLWYSFSAFGIVNTADVEGTKLFNIQNKETLATLESIFSKKNPSITELDAFIDNLQKFSDISQIPNPTTQVPIFLLHWIYIMKKQNLRLNEINWFLDTYKGKNIPQRDKIIQKAEDIINQNSSTNLTEADYFYRNHNLAQLKVMSRYENVEPSNIRFRNLQALKDFLNPFNTRYEKMSNILWENKYNTTKTKQLIEINFRGSKEAAIFMARMYLQQNNKSYFSYLSQLDSNEIKNDDGLMYDLVRYFIKNNERDKLLKLLVFVPKTSYYEKQWWKLKKQVVFDVLRDPNSKRADYLLVYKLISEHEFLGEEDEASANWYAGFIAQEFLGDSIKAIKHFETAFENTKYAKLKAKIAYWNAQAYKSMGYTKEYGEWLGKAIIYPSTYYGQISLFELIELDLKDINKRFDPSFNPADPSIINCLQAIDKLLEKYQAEVDKGKTTSAAELNNFLTDPLLAGAVNLIGTGMQNEAKEFLLTYIRYSGDKFGVILALNIFSNHLSKKSFQSALEIADIRDLILKDSVLLNYRYKFIPLQNAYSHLHSLIYAIIYRESAFDPSVISGSGAKGMMQLMPGTAQHLSKTLGLAYNPNRLIQDPNYNIALGSHYIQKLMGQFDYNPILAIASYNAGSGNVNKWLNETPFPDTKNTHEIAKWIELIPFLETRYYVTMVLSTEMMYRYLLWKQEKVK